MGKLLRNAVLVVEEPESFFQSYNSILFLLSKAQTLLYKIFGGSGEMCTFFFMATADINMELSGLGVKLELQHQAYATATETLDPGHISKLC